VSDTTQKYPLWQNHYLQAMAETRPELLKSKITAAEQVVSLRSKQHSPSSTLNRDCTRHPSPKIRPMAIVKYWAKLLAVAAALYVFFRYFGNFPSQQSAALAFVLAAGYELYSDLNASRRASDAFEPFCVSIYPNWYKLLSHFGESFACNVH
jgi:hypothetical protein